MKDRNIGIKKALSTFALVCILIMTSCSGKNANNGETEGNGKIGEFVYLDVTNTIHIDRHCPALLTPKPAVRDKSLKTAGVDYLNLSQFCEKVQHGSNDVYYCPQCIDDESYKRLINCVQNAYKPKTNKNMADKYIYTYTGRDSEGKLYKIRASALNEGSNEQIAGMKIKMVSPDGKTTRWVSPEKVDYYAKKGVASPVVTQTSADRFVKGKEQPKPKPTPNPQGNVRVKMTNAKGDVKYVKERFVPNMEGVGWTIAEE